MQNKFEKYEKKIQQLENDLNNYQAAVNELKVLNEIAVAAGRAGDIDQTLKLILYKTVSAVNAEHGSILLVSPSQEVLKTFIKQENNSKVRNTPHIGEHITGWILLNKKSLIIKDLGKDERFRTTDEEKKHIKSLISSPIWFEGKIIGVLQMINKKNHEPFSDNDLTLLSIISVQAGQLIKNSELQNLSYEKKKEAEVARLESEKLQELDKIKTNFFTNLSHEFRTPLTLILGPLEKLMDEKNYNKDERLKLIYKNATRLLRLINQLLDLSSIGANKMELTLHKGDIITFIKGVSASFQPLADIKNIKLIFTSPFEDLIMLYDKDKLEKILSNLLINAVKFTGNNNETENQGIINITIPENLIDKNGYKMIEIIIEDSGIGIPSDNINNVFDRFFTKKGNLIDEISEGTGIGLSLVKELVELHQGNISVESEIKKGTKFIIQLPFDRNLYCDYKTDFHSTFNDYKENIEVNSHPTKIEKELNRDEIPLVLIAEDNEDIRKFIKESLIQKDSSGNENLTILESLNGKEALEKAIKNIPDLIISDVLMPEMDGIQFCETIKTDEKTSHIPVILLTSRSQIENKVKGLETGADDYITKPFNIAELQTRVNNLINQRKLLRQKYRKEVILEPKEVAVTSIDETFLKKIINIIDVHISDTEFSVDELAKEAGLSRMQLHRKLNALTGQTSNDLIKSYRLNKAAKLLLTKSGNISEIGYEVGFNNPAYFATCFKELFGYSPSEYLQKFIPI